MPSFFTGLNPRLYLGVGIVVVILLGVSYVNGLKSDLADEKKLRIDTKAELDEANKNLDLAAAAYEQTLAIEKEISNEKAIALEQKIEVTKTTNKVKEALIKRGEIKQDEKSNFTIVTF